MTNEQIETTLKERVKSERKITREILELIVLAERQRLPEERGFKNTHDWLIRGIGYSAPAANRRIQSARLLRDVPEVAGQVEAGELNLTTLWQTQRTIRSQQQKTGKRVSLEQKRQALSKIANQTSDQAERELHTLFPEAAPSGEKVTHHRDGGKTVMIELTAEEAAELERARELLSNALPGATFGQVIARLAREFNKRQHGAVRHRVTVRNGQCTYKDPITKRVCGSRHFLEVDHILPKAMGGSDDPANLRCLCRRHNQLVAEQIYGREFMERHRLVMR